MSDTVECGDCGESFDYRQGFAHHQECTGKRMPSKMELDHESARRQLI